MLGEKLRNAFELLRGARLLDEETIKKAIKEIQRALIASDVEVKLVLELTKKIEKEAKKKPPKGIDRREYIIKLVYDELVKILGGETKPVEKPKRILLVGLFGSGKTTTAAKLGKWYSKRGLKVALIAADTFRPAAFEQLKQLAEKAKLGFFGIKGEKNAAKVVEKALKELNNYDLLIVDSAGRNALNKEMIEEIKGIERKLKPDNIWLVISADIGQVARKQAKAFKEAVNINGVIITKMDGSAKGGGALAACHETNAKVYFIGVGEKLDDLQLFDANRFLSRIMGYGDLQALLEKIEEIKEEIEIRPEELLKQDFNLEVFYKQLVATRKMGPFSKVAEMLGLKAQLPKEYLELTEEKLNNFKVIMDSMTKQEKRNPEIINFQRIQRIAKGSGKTQREVRELLRQYKLMKRMLKKMKKFKDEKFLKKLEKGGFEQLIQMFSKRKKKFKIR
ncbi:MAG: signal recognition particle protein [Candidatus Diapherotrites archaeon]|nr:signal recognition particle protein [Candidatus Diapherotrites archaeon]